MADAEEEEAPQDPGDGPAPAEEDEEAVDGEDEEETDEGEEEEAASEEEDPFEMLDESEEDDEVERAMYREYLEVVKEIDGQNLVIKKLKTRADELMYKRCKTFRDKQDFKALRKCLEQEDIHLRALIIRAMQLQNFGSRRLYGDVELELTNDEQNYFTGAPSSIISDNEKCCVNKGMCCCSDSDSDTDSDSDSDEGLCWS
ncbi:hypothetical protein KR009_001835 [Drosophila setifemur]|nr:hypothetical protein KR009_001835 [Drosophila setifemur]